MGDSSSRGRSEPGQGYGSSKVASSSPALAEQSQQKTFKWTIDGFSSLLDKDEGWTYSRVFEIMGHNCIFGVDFVNVFTAEAYTTTHAVSTSEALFVQKMNTANVAKVYTWDIEDFSGLKCPYYSPEFEFGGCKWCVSLYPPDQHEHYISLYLQMETPDDLSENSAKLVQLTLSIKDWKLASTGKQQAGNHSHTITLCRDEECYISRKDFEDPSSGFLVENKCCIEGCNCWFFRDGVCSHPSGLNCNGAAQL